MTECLKDPMSITTFASHDHKNKIIQVEQLLYDVSQRESKCDRDRSPTATKELMHNRLIRRDVNSHNLKRGCRRFHPEEQTKDWAADLFLF